MSLRRPRGTQLNRPTAGAIVTTGTQAERTESSRLCEPAALPQRRLAYRHRAGSLWPKTTTPSNNGQSVRRYGWRDARFGVRRQKIRSAKSRAEDKPDVGCPTVPGSPRRHEDVERRASLDSYGFSRRRFRRPRKARLQLIQIIFADERRPCKMWIDTRDEL
jgi:hypothetical protein